MANFDHFSTSLLKFREKSCRNLYVLPKTHPNVLRARDYAEGPWHTYLSEEVRSLVAHWSLSQIRPCLSHVTTGASSEMLMKMTAPGPVAVAGWSTHVPFDNRTHKEIKVEKNTNRLIGSRSLAQTHVHDMLRLKPFRRGRQS
jgi:hypothetical protein